jgi:acetyl esterase/lipase
MQLDLTVMSRHIRALGDEISPRTIEGTAALYAPFQEREPYRSVQVIRDIRYGSHERHRLDVFAPEKPEGAARAVVVFIHGGGFVGGDKKNPGTPFNDNVALWAVRNGFIGVNITYRLAPEFQWPAGAQDVAEALKWVRANIPAHGADASRIFLLGTSAGAVHAATYLVNKPFHAAEGPGVAGAVLLSGIYNLTTFERSPLQRAYLGDDDAKYAAASSLEGLLETPVPLLFVLTEMDPPGFQRQSLELVNAWVRRHGRWPNFVRLQGHNHLSSSMHLNSPDTYLGQEIIGFISGSTP